MVQLARRKHDTRLIIASEHLNRWYTAYENYVLEIKRMDILKRELKEIKSVDYAYQRLSKTNRQKDLSDYMVLIEAQEQRINKARDFYRQVDSELSELLSKIPAEHRSILKAVYDNNMTLQEVASHYHYAYRTAQKKHNRALLEVYNILQEQKTVAA